MHLNLTLDLSRSRSYLSSSTIERSLLGSCLYYWDHLSGEITISLASMMFVQLNLYFHEVISSLLALLTLGHIGYITGIMPWFTLCFVLLCFSCVEFNPYSSGLLHWLSNPFIVPALQWCHNEHDGISNHQRIHCLLNCLFRCRSKKNIKALRHWPLCGEFTGDNSPHKGPVTRKIFTFDNVVMIASELTLRNMEK